MSCSFKVLDSKDLEGVVPPNQQFALDVLIGLSEKPKRLSSMYFYDDVGSVLFQQIMALPEYYLTNCEFEILKTHSSSIVDLIGEGESFNLIELGAGDGTKTSLLIEQFLKREMSFQYIPIDISQSAMQILMKNLAQQFKKLTANGLVAEYFDGLRWISQINTRRNLVLILGSNLGNFNQAKTRVFLRSLWNVLKDGDLVVIGFDLKKDIDVMLKAYNDSRGITAQFNLNLLNRINNELGGQFNLDTFRFYANYNVFSGAIESFLVSLTDQTVFVAQIGESFHFDAWEPIHTEYSYKFLKSDIEKLAANTGYRIEKQLFDSKHYFTDSIWSVEKKQG